MIRRYIIEADDSLKGFDEAIEKLEREWGAEEIEGSEDCVSREQAINEINKKVLCHTYEAREIIENLPSAQPQPKRGKWIEVIDELDSFGNKTWHYECSICGNRDFGWGDYKYCPKCGADMREVQDER